MPDVRAQLEETLGSIYTIERELGGGGMSRVILARDVALGRDVVIKMLTRELAAGVSIDRFEREIMLAARLQQANIVPVLSAGNAGGIPYYTMPYVDGQSLRARLERGAIPLGDAIDILRDVARALAYAHARGIVHRDIKPENVLLSSGTAVVTDFGIAKALSASRTQDVARGNTLTQAGTSLGTPAYLSPEQALGDTVDARADLYSWGVMAYELLAGAHPFATSTSAQRLIAAHVTETPVPLEGVRPEIPASVATLVMQCLEKDPAQRPASADEVLAHLATAMTPGTLSRGPERAHRGRRSQRTLIASAAALLFVLIVAGTMFARRSAAAEDRTVVVVPFDNVGDPADAYFAEGVSDEIASQLARLPGVRVIGRDGVRRFRGSAQSPRDIAHTLGAAWVLSGSVRWARAANGAASSAGVNGATRVRIVPALVNASTGEQAWGEPFDEPLTDVFSVQADIAERVASALSVTLGGSARAALRRPDTDNPQARDAQMQGRYLLRQRGVANLHAAVAAFDHAIALDSNYARAWAGLSEATVLLPQYEDTTESVAVVLARAEADARRAIAIDSTLPDVQLALARSQSAQFRFHDALRSVDRAIALDSASTFAYTLKYEILTALGDADEANRAAARAVALDGLSALALNNRALSLMVLGQRDSAVYYSERAVAVDPSGMLWRRTLGLLYAMDGRVHDAIPECMAGPFVTLAACEAMMGAVAGESAARPAALATLAEMGRRPGTTGAPMLAALVYARLGMPDSVFARIAVAVSRHDDSFTHVITYPDLTRLQSDPRWDAIVGAVRRR